MDQFLKYLREHKRRKLKRAPNRKERQAAREYLRKYLTFNERTTAREISDGMIARLREGLEAIGTKPRKKRE